MRDLSRNADTLIQYLTAGTRIYTDHCPSDSRLSRTGLTYKRESLPLIYIKAGVLDSLHRTVALAESDIYIFDR